MNILGNNSSKLNEVIFEKRNKDYGAYAIRQSYNDSLKKSLLCLASIVLFLFGFVLINNKINSNTEKQYQNIFEDPILKPLIYSTPIDFTPLKEPVQSSNVAAAPKGTTIGKIITDDKIEATEVDLNNSVNGVGTKTATGVDPLSTNESTLTVTNSVAITSPPETNEPMATPDEMPEFEGGVVGLMRYIGQNISYPEVAKIINKEGTVYVSFVVNEYGFVENVKVMRGIGYGCDEEVLKVVSKMPRWKKVGKNNGHPVKVRYNIPVSFKLK